MNSLNLVMILVNKQKDFFFDLCKKCGSKCCKPNITPNPFHINISSKDTSKLLLKYSCLLDIIHLKENSYSFIIKPHVFGYCSFLEYEAGKCLIYNERPFTCSEFPYNDDRSVIKEDCLILQNKKMNHNVNSKEIGSKSSSQIKFIEDEKKISNENMYNDFLSFQYRFTANRKFINSKYGSYQLRFSSEIHDKELQNLIKLFYQYKSFLNLDELYVKCRVVNSHSNKFYTLQGILSQKQEYSLKQVFHRYENLSTYYQNINDGSLMEGIVFTDDINNSFKNWNKIWLEYQHRVLEKVDQ